MINTLVVIIPGDPVPQARPRFTIKKGKVIVYDTKACKAWKRTAAYAMWEEAQPDEEAGTEGFEMATGPVEVHISAMFRAPQSKPKKAGVTNHTKKNGDIDNIAKIVLDAGNGVLWKDDAQVCHLYAYKSVGKRGMEPMVTVVVKKLEEGK
ncbi:MAG: RusA family crossover junction endodeoxyribonuclease [Planctomycetota bacterium]|jgi:Holliday junction resolvase RusA-like endonuclease